MGGDVVVGTSVWRGVSLSDVYYPIGTGSIGIESHVASLTALWRSPGGFYAEGQAQYARFSIDTLARGSWLVRDNDSRGMRTSAETGYHFAVPFGRMDFRVTPQVQLVWSRVGFDDFVDPRGGLVSVEDGDLVKGRLGLSWDGEWSVAGGSGHIYGGMNLRGALDGKTAVNVSGSSFVAEWKGLSIDGRLGVSYEWDEGYAVHGEALTQHRDGVGEVRASLGVSIDF